MNTAKLAAATVLALSFTTGLAAAATAPRDTDMQTRPPAHAVYNSVYGSPAWQFRCTQARNNPFENPGMVQQFCGSQAQ